MSAQDLVLAAVTDATVTTFISSSINYAATAGNTVGAPSGIQDGDLLVAVGFRLTPSGTTITPPAGFNVQCFENATDNVLFVATKVAASESGSYTFTWSDVANNAISILVYRNATRVNTVGTKASSPSSATNTLGSITPTYAGTVLAAFGAGGLKTISSAPLGMTRRSLVAIGVSLTVYDQGLQPASATGDKEITWSSGGNVGGLLLHVTNEPTVAPEFVASASTQKTSNSSTLLINKPTGTAENDLMVAVLTTTDDDGPNWTSPAGWTEVADQTVAPHLSVAYKVAGASEGSNYNFSYFGGGLLSGCILTYRYAAYDTIGSYATNADPLVLPSISPSESQSILVAAGARRVPSTTLGTPTSMTARVTDNDANSPSYNVCDQTVAKGPVGTRSMSTADTDVAGILLSIKPTRSL